LTEVRVAQACFLRCREALQGIKMPPVARRPMTFRKSRVRMVLEGDAGLGL